MKPEDVVSDILKAITEKAKIGINLLDLENSRDFNYSMVQLAPTRAITKVVTFSFPQSFAWGNDVIAHPVPTDYILKDGDLFLLIGNYGKRYVRDAGLTIPIGMVSTKIDTC